LEASDNLADEDIDAEVVDRRSVSPIDFETIEEAVREAHEYECEG